MSTDYSLITVPTDAGDMPTHQWLPEGGSGPGLVLVQEIFGVSDYIQERAADLAGLGYVVLAPEVYWRLEDTAVDESRDDFLQRAMGIAGRVDWPAAVSDVRAALRHLRDLPEVEGGVGVIGFCFGGGLAFNVAAVDSVDVLVSYYGSALPQLLDLAPQVDAPSLHHFGTADAFLDTATVERIREAVTAAPGEVRFETYDGAGHAFDNPHPQFHHPEASRQAWRTTASFLEQHLPPVASRR
ncbi:MAG: dienelactone hydrolase family protein [Nocardioidaceae bacterium]